MSTLPLAPGDLFYSLHDRAFQTQGWSAGGNTDSSDQLNTAERVESFLGRNLVGFSDSPIQTFRIQQLQIGLRSVALAAQQTSINDDVIRTSQVLMRRAVVDLRVSSAVLERYARRISTLQEQNPELLRDFLALIELLDQKLPEELDAFFERLRLILEGRPEAIVQQRPDAAIDINLPVPTEAEPTEQAESFFFQVRLSVTGVQITTTTSTAQSDPLILDLDGDGIEVTSVEEGRLFDIDADGAPDRTAFVQCGDAFLAFDRNGNGTIDDGSELFGDQHGATDGFAELERFDDNDDRLIDRSDNVFAGLMLFDGESLLRLADAGIVSLSTLMEYGPVPEINGNRVAGTASYLREDGSNGTTADLFLNYLA